MSSEDTIAEQVGENDGGIYSFLADHCPQANQGFALKEIIRRTAFSLVFAVGGGEKVFQKEGLAEASEGSRGFKRIVRD